MKPTLIDIAGEGLSSFLVMMALGYALAIWISVREAKRTGIDHDIIIDLGLYSVIFGVLGGRLAHVLFDGFFLDYVNLCIDPQAVTWNISEVACRRAGGRFDSAEAVCRAVSRDCFAWAAFWRGGLTYYGGLAAPVLFGLYFLKKHGVSRSRVADFAGLTIPLGHFCGRVGCFLGGCCFGDVWREGGVSFPASSPASEKHVQLGLLEHAGLPSLPVHPTQLYEALGCLVIFAVLVLRVYPRKRFDGYVFLVFLASYSLLRFSLEFLRADDRGGLGVLSTSQWLSILGLVIAGFAYPRLARQRELVPGSEESNGI